MRAHVGFVRATILASILGSAELCAQPSTPASPTRMVLASTSLTTVVDAPRYYAVFRLNIATSQPTIIRGNGFLYVLTGSVTAVNGEKRTILKEGEAIPTLDSLKIEEGPTAVVLHFFLGRQDELPEPSISRGLIELFRTPAPIPSLKSGLYEFSFVRVAFPPMMPANAPHHRSGAAIYYVLSGTGLFIADGKQEPRPTGSIQYEPNDLMHQWANGGESPLVFLQANISQEGVPAVIFK